MFFKKSDRNVSDFLSYKDISEKISSEEKKNNFISAFLIAHGFLESYLSELIIYSNKNIDLKVSNDLLKTFERVSFGNLLIVNFMIGNINFELFKKIYSFNKKRNVLVHELASIDLDDEKVLKKIKRDVSFSKIILKEIHSIYTKKIKLLSKKFV